MPLKVSTSGDPEDVQELSFGGLTNLKEEEIRTFYDSIGGDISVIFKTMRDERVRAWHAALEGTLWDADDPNAPRPPLERGCRCKIYPRANTKAAAERTGLQRSPTDPPEPGDEALNQFWLTSEQSEKSNDPGGPVTPQDTFGKTIGKDIEEKKIKPIDTFNKETGDVRPASEVTNIVNAKESGRSVRSVFSGFAILGTFAISPSERIKIISQATALIKENPSLSDAQALFDVIMKLKPGLVGTLFGVSTTKNARRVARAILRTNGPLKREDNGD